MTEDQRSYILYMLEALQTEINEHIGELHHLICDATDEVTAATSTRELRIYEPQTPAQFNAMEAESRANRNRRW